MKMIWPEMFKTGVVEFTGTIESKISLTADALTAWGNCSLDKPPENFGEVMAKVGMHLGTESPKGLMELSDELLKQL